MWLDDLYYPLNNIWVYGNIIMIVPFLISTVSRLFNKGGHDLKLHLWTDHICRVMLVFTEIFYVFDIIVKYRVDGIDQFCEKTFFVHHVGTLFLLPPLFINRYIPWWVPPVGFMHGFLLAFPQYELLNYVYVVFVFLFQYGLYQTPFKDLKGYWLSRYTINYIWVFALMLLAGNCTNHLDLSAP